MGSVKFHRLESQNPGPHLIVFGALHGEEPCGKLALERFLSEGHRLQSGTVTLIPICNPQAFEKNVLFVDANLNRIFKKYDAPQAYEEHLANELTSLCDQADCLLDLHSSTGDGGPYLFIDHDTPENKNLAKATGLDRWVVGWTELYASLGSIESYDTTGYMHANGKAGILIECGQHADPDAPQIAYQCLRRVLHALGLLAFDSFKPHSANSVARISHVILREKQGRFTQEWVNFDPVRKGQPVIAYDDGSFATAPFDGFILLPRKNAKPNEEWIYFGAPESQSA
jgi:predicted deacylase